MNLPNGADGDWQPGVDKGQEVVFHPHARPLLIAFAGLTLDGCGLQQPKRGKRENGLVVVRIGDLARLKDAVIVNGFNLQTRRVGHFGGQQIEAVVGDGGIALERIALDRHQSTPGARGAIVKVIAAPIRGHEIAACIHRIGSAGMEGITRQRGQQLAKFGWILSCPQRSASRLQIRRLLRG